MNSQTKLFNSDPGLQLTITATAKATPAYSEQAWHILALLLSFGRPARPSELASRCTLFYTTPNLIEFLCSVPNSPIELTRSYFVSFSSTAYVALLNLANADAWGNLNFVPRFLGELGFVRQGRAGEQALRVYCRKKRKIDLDGECFPMAKKRGILEKLHAQYKSKLALECAGGTEIASGKACLSDDNINKTITMKPYKPPFLSLNEWEPDKRMLRTTSLLDSGNAMFMSGLGNTQSWNAIEPMLVNRRGTSDICYAVRDGYQLDSPIDNLYLPASESQKKTRETIPDQKVNHLAVLPCPVVSTTAEMKDEHFVGKIKLAAKSCTADGQQSITPQTQVTMAISDHETTTKVMEFSERLWKKPSQISCCATGFTKKHIIDPTEKELSPKDITLENAANGQRKMITSEDKYGRTPLKSRETLIIPGIPSPKQQVKSFPKSKLDQKEAKSYRLKLTAKTLDYGNGSHSLEKQQQLKKYKKAVPSNHAIQQDTNQNGKSKSKIESDKKYGQSSFTSAPGQCEQKVLPDFESFKAEEEEGSGGYGTVYKARRKNDGAAFAIKCPHVNANRNHVRNELRMLGRFGGKNFIIKYEGSFRNGDSDCLVLEHVEHDRPEVLKREIDVSELQWYGYCMFRALASLHKQGIIHRDVKPGNFLFNRKACKGYLIDFNLAMDLYQKHGSMEKTRMGQDVSFAPVPLPQSKSLPPMKIRKLPTSKALHLEHQEQGKVPKFVLQSKKIKQDNEHQNPKNKGGNWNIIKSTGADGSGITSAKDTSTMTLSGEKWKEPLPSQGRKELLSLVQEALQGANQKEVNGPLSKRKRVEAPAQLVDRKIIYQTPMPLHSFGVAVTGAGLLKSKGHGKHNREGPCVGTKGFRAPEAVQMREKGPSIETGSVYIQFVFRQLEGREDKLNIWSEIPYLYFNATCKNEIPVPLQLEVHVKRKHKAESHGQVLFRSLHQGPKVDMWSAGVTLLYLIIGRAPFTGEPDQNLKEIAKLRGSEDLWEVAKLHGRESSFPMDLLDVKSLSSMTLCDWCKLHTRRPGFLDVIPRSLLDLLDMCLTVNPRLRISAEDALKHEFFAPCHDTLRKHRLLKQGAGQDSCPNPVSQVRSQISAGVQ